MHRQRPTRVPAFQFKGKKTRPLRLGYFKNENDLFDTFCHWMDYHDPIGIVQHPNPHQEYAPEVRDLMEAIKDCHGVEDFALAIRQCIIQWFGDEDLVKPHFWKRYGYRRFAETGWALWRRYQFDMGLGALQDLENSKAKH